MDSSEIDYESESDIFASPTKALEEVRGSEVVRGSLSRRGSEAGPPKTPSQPTKAPAFDAEEVRETALRRELEGVRNINRVIEGVIATLEKAKGNMGTVSQTVSNATTLLNQWTRLLSQTEHTQRVILNPNWHGAVKEQADLENEALQRQLAAERRAAEEERRKEEARRKLEEEAARRAAAAAVTPAPRGGATRGTRGRGRAVVRSSGYGTASYRPAQRSTTPAADNTTSSNGSGRGTSGIGRGYGLSRGRARGSRP